MLVDSFHFRSQKGSSATLSMIGKDRAAAAVGLVFARVIWKVRQLCITSTDGQCFGSGFVDSGWKKTNLEEVNDVLAKAAEKEKKEELSVQLNKQFLSISITIPDQVFLI